MVSMIGLKYVLEYRDKDASTVRKKLNNDRFIMLGDWSLWDSLSDLKKKGIKVRVYKISTFTDLVENSDEDYSLTYVRKEVR